ncbi:hypothetical protein TWF970_004082 [Orbilia oligospora]|uniref:Uncharacterized protein n=1 Tax=Orbilia oligospora TaxID=2813651 RepID=A0A7C8R8L2_ORBOL|nr:hypothetical protein TWF970_004082 [Orbilia oligospora]
MPGSESGGTSDVPPLGGDREGVLSKPSAFITTSVSFSRRAPLLSYGSQSVAEPLDLLSKPLRSHLSPSLSPPPSTSSPPSSKSQSFPPFSLQGPQLPGYICDPRQEAQKTLSCSTCSYCTPTTSIGNSEVVSSLLA